jgi:hypothetical protein
LGALTKPQTKTVDPTPDAVKPLQGDIAGFLQGLFQSGGQQNPFGGMTSPLQQMATGGMKQFLSQNPEQQTLNMLQPGLVEMFSRNSAEGVGAAAMPLFQQGLQFAQGSLANSGQGRFSTAFENQGIGLAQRAMQDFNLLQNQAFMQDQQNRLGAGNLLGSLAGQAGQGAFGRNLQAGQLGLGMTQQAVNPILQLLLGGMGFGQPMGKETIVGKSPLSQIGDIGLGIATLGTMRGGGGGGGA